MQLKDLMSGIAVVIDDALGDTATHESNRRENADLINRIVERLKQQWDLPFYTATKLPPEQTWPNLLQAASFVLLDWRLWPTGASHLERVGVESNVRFLHEAKGYSVPVFILTNESPDHVAKELPQTVYDHDLPEQNFIFLQRKADLVSGDSLDFNDIENWIRQKGETTATAGDAAITSLRLVDFKNFADETLRVGTFTVIVGANASGKSNIRDAFRFLHGIGRGYTLAEILGGRWGPDGRVEWQAIRGASNEVSRMPETKPGPRFALEVRLRLGDASGRHYIEASRGAGHAGGFRVVREELWTGGLEPVYTSHPVDGEPLAQNDETRLSLRMAKIGSQRKQGHSVAVRSDQPALTQIREHKWLAKSYKDDAQRVIDALAGMRFLDLIPDRMRQPSFPGQTILGDGGENLPTVLRQICTDRTRRRRLIDWVRALTPMDVDDLQFPVDPITGLVQLVVVEKGGRTCSAYSVSDGTLRFLAMLAALLADDPTRFYFFEEIDNGIHPARQWLLLELIEKQTAAGGVQVVTTTHSPGLLTSINDSTFRHTSLVCRPESTTDAIIRPVAELPDAVELRTSQGLGRLLMGGWMEDMIAFTEDAGDSDA